MLANGATTLWERWELATGNGMNSHNHPMLGSVDAWFYRAVAGIRACSEGPGFERFDICPAVDIGLTSASASLQTVRGTIECSWELIDEGLELNVTVPFGSQACIYLPHTLGCILREGDNILWKDEHPDQPCSDGQNTYCENRKLVCMARSGSYHFRLLQLVRAEDTVRLIG
jgi:alpha-L-rhamnosidase